MNFFLNKKNHARTSPGNNTTRTNTTNTVADDTCARAPALWLSELTVPEGVGYTSGVVGVPEVDVELAVVVAALVEAFLELVVLVLVLADEEDADARCTRRREAGSGCVAVSEGMGWANVPVIFDRLFFEGRRLVSWLGVGDEM